MNGNVVSLTLKLLLMSAPEDSLLNRYLSYRPTLSLPALHDHNYQAAGLYLIRNYQSCSLLEVLQ
jgi:hypothetical protein